MKEQNGARNFSDDPQPSYSIALPCHSPEVRRHNHGQRPLDGLQSTINFSRHLDLPSLADLNGRRERSLGPARETREDLASLGGV